MAALASQVAPHRQRTPMRKVFLGLAAAAAIATPLAVAGSATAANPGNGSLVITSQAQADQAMAQGVINKNVDVPQGADVQLRWVDIKGNLSVEGKLSLASSQIEGNAVVSGPNAGLTLFNDPGNHFWGNLTVNQAGGYWFGTPIGLGVHSDGQQVDGNLTFTNNTSGMMLSGGVTVNGDFTYSGNALAYPGGLTVVGKPSIS
jgi:hypothetical protein